MRESPKFYPVFVHAHWKCKRILFYDDWLRFIFLPVCKSHIDYFLSLCPIVYGLVTLFAIVGSAINLTLTNQLCECVSVDCLFLLCEWHDITTHNCPNRLNLMGCDHQAQWDIYIIICKSDQKGSDLFDQRRNGSLHECWIRSFDHFHLQMFAHSNDSNSKIIKTIVWPSSLV